MSRSYRVALDYEGGAESGPPTVVVKVAAEDETSRATGVQLGAYEREIRFYREVAPRARGAGRPGRRVLARVGSHGAARARAGARAGVRRPAARRDRLAQRRLAAQ